MGPILGTLALLLAALLTLAGCGDEDAPGTAVPECDDGGACAYPTILVSGTAGGGEVSTEPTVLEDPEDLTAYVEQFSDAFAAEVTQAVDVYEVPPGHAVGAAVVAIGCDVPPGVDVETTTDGVTMVPKPVPSPMLECFAPVTTVALAVVPET